MLRRLFGVGLSCRNSYVRGYGRRLETTHAMANTVGVPLKEVVDELRKFADTSLAASWDNVGLLVEPTQPKIVSCILLTNDLTEDVMEEAVRLKTDLIITYHPLIFAPLRAITTQSWKERVVARCLENKIAVYSPHTSFDSIRGGVNDWLADAFKFEDSRPIEPNASNATYGLGRLCTLKQCVDIDDVVKLVKQHTDGSVKTIALCAGSGGSVLKGISADVYLTGEMLHHDVLDAVHRGVHVILTNHSDSERGYLKVFAPILDRKLRNSVRVCVSVTDRDPLQTV